MTRQASRTDRTRARKLRTERRRKRINDRRPQPVKKQSSDKSRLQPSIPSNIENIGNNDIAAVPPPASVRPQAQSPMPRQRRPSHLPPPWAAAGMPPGGAYPFMYPPMPYPGYPIAPPSNTDNNPLSSVKTWEILDETADRLSAGQTARSPTEIMQQTGLSNEQIQGFCEILRRLKDMGIQQYGLEPRSIMRRISETNPNFSPDSLHNLLWRYAYECEQQNPDNFAGLTESIRMGIAQDAVKHVPLNELHSATTFATIDSQLPALTQSYNIVWPEQEHFHQEYPDDPFISRQLTDFFHRQQSTPPDKRHEFTTQYTAEQMAALENGQTQAATIPLLYNDAQGHTRWSIALVRNTITPTKEPTAEDPEGAPMRTFQIDLIDPTHEKHSLDPASYNPDDPTTWPKRQAISVANSQDACQVVDAIHRSTLHTRLPNGITGHRDNIMDQFEDRVMPVEGSAIHPSATANSPIAQTRTGSLLAAMEGCLGPMSETYQTVRSEQLWNNKQYSDWLDHKADGMINNLWDSFLNTEIGQKTLGHFFSPKAANFATLGQTQGMQELATIAQDPEKLQKLQQDANNGDQTAQQQMAMLEQMQQQQMAQLAQDPEKLEELKKASLAGDKDAEQLLTVLQQMQAGNN